MSTIKHVLYTVRRNTRGSLPVYSDVRNGAHRVLIRHVDGANSLAQDLGRSLFPPDSPQAQRLAVRVHQQRHIILSGGRFKRDVLAWLTAKGF